MPRAYDLDRPWGRLRVWGWGADDVGPSISPTVVAVHGLGGSGRYWDGLADALGSEVRLLAPDLAGFGSSDTPAGHATRDLHLADLEAVAEELAPEAPIVAVGHSLGGALVALWAARSPGRIAGLGLACSPFPGDDDLDYRHVHEEAPTWRRLGARAARPIWPALAAPIAVVKKLPYAVVRDFGRQSFRARVWTMWSVLSDPGAAEELLPLRDLDLPALLLDAVDDTLVPGEDRTRWREMLPQAEQLILADGGHQLLFRTRFEPMARWIREMVP